MVPNRKLRDFFFDVAEEEGLPLQADVLTGYGEDGAEIQRYAIDLRSMTAGLGSFEMTHYDYRPLPEAMVDGVVAAAAESS